MKIIRHPKEIRDWGSQGGLRCPNCEAQLFINISGGTRELRDNILLAELALEKAGGDKQLITREDAEEYARKHGLEILDED